MATERLAAELPWSYRFRSRQLEACGNSIAVSRPRRLYPSRPDLEEALLSDELMLFSHPPERVSDYARFVLEELHPESLSDTRSNSARVLAAPAKAPLTDVAVKRNGCKA